MSMDPRTDDPTIFDDRTSMPAAPAPRAGSDEPVRTHAGAIAAAPARGRGADPTRAMRALRMALAAACAVGVLAIGLQWRQADIPFRPRRRSPPLRQPMPLAKLPQTTFDAYTMLDETPDLYLWLASNDAAALAME